MARFGLELEFLYPRNSGFGAAQRICDALNAAGIPVENHTHTHVGFSRSHWMLKRDGSVSAGGELVSPPMEFGDDLWREQVQIISRVLTTLECDTNENCGIHVHVECRDFTPKQLAATLRFVYKFEDALYRIASSGYERIRQSSYMQPVTDELAQAAMTIRDETQLARLWINCVGRYQAINPQVWYQRGTLEFRLFNSSLNAKRITAYVAVASAIVNDARNGYSRSTKKHFAAGWMRTGGNPSMQTNAWGSRVMTQIPNDPEGQFGREKQMLLKLQQIWCYQSGMSREDWKLVRFCWQESNPPEFTEVHHNVRWAA